MANKWKCSVCGKMNFERNPNCTNCGLERGYKSLLDKHLKLNRGKKVGKGRRGQSLMPSVY